MAFSPQSVQGERRERGQERTLNFLASSFRIRTALTFPKVEKNFSISL
jgi:hypothetical protein